MESTLKDLCKENHKDSRAILYLAYSNYLFQEYPMLLSSTRSLLLFSGSLSYFVLYLRSLITLFASILKLFNLEFGMDELQYHL